MVKQSACCRGLGESQCLAFLFWVESSSLLPGFPPGADYSRWAFLFHHSWYDPLYVLQSSLPASLPHHLELRIHLSPYSRRPHIHAPPPPVLLYLQTMPFTPDSRNPVFQSSFACHCPCSQPSSLGNITAHVHAPSSWLSSQRLARAHAHSSIENTNELQFMIIKLMPFEASWLQC